MDTTQLAVSLFPHLFEVQFSRCLNRMKLDPAFSHMQGSPVSGEDSHAGVGQHVQTECAQTFDKRHCPLQGHLLLAAG